MRIPLKGWALIGAALWLILTITRVSLPFWPLWWLCLILGGVGIPALVVYTVRQDSQWNDRYTKTLSESSTESLAPAIIDPADD